MLSYPNLKHLLRTALTTITAVGLQLIPLAARADDAATPPTALQNPLGTVTVWEIFGRVASGINFITGALALFFIILGGYRILSAGGNSEHFQKGKQMITYAILGLILTVGSYAILATTITVLTGTAGPPAFSTNTVLIDPLNLNQLPTKQAGFVFFGQRLLGFILSGLAGVSILMFVYGGTLWLTSAGNEERVAKAKRTLLYATIGLVVVMSSYIFISFVYGPFYHILTQS